MSNLEVIRKIWPVGERWHHVVRPGETPGYTDIVYVEDGVEIEQSRLMFSADELPALIKALQDRFAEAKEEAK